jgi:hypothetical protein
MNAPARRATAMLASLAAAWLAAACAQDGPTAARPNAPALTAIVDSSISSDSVCAGYGSGSTGGIEYECFEYEPETGTEYVVTPDTNETTPPPPAPPKP